MKHFILVSTVLLSFNLYALNRSGDVLISSMEGPIAFKFKQDIQLKAINGVEGKVAGKVYEHQGLGRFIGRGNSCSLEKNVDAGVQKTTILAENNHGVEWSIRLTKRENLGLQRPSIEIPELAMIPQEYRPVVKKYVHEFTITNDNDVKMTLTCTHVCSEPTARSKPSKVSCQDRLPVGTDLVLESLGVQLKRESIAQSKASGSAPKAGQPKSAI